ncbi:MULTISPECIES: Nre family DNA repair protein [Archaeoglobus]|nr:MULTISPECIES: Nre family DNA repair protein [Archaeoglobus]
MLCSRKVCPLMPSLRPQVSVERDILGSSPPSVFVGRYGYPKVRICPAVPPFTGDTKIYDTPEMWREVPVERVLEFRYSMILGQFRADVRRSKEVEVVQEMSLYDKPIDVEVSFAKPPSVRAFFDDVLPPFGASAPAKEVIIHSAPRPPKAVEKVYYDTDLRAVEAMSYLYERGVAVSHIQKLLSAGTLGVKRKLVPTRWAITAVDDTLSKQIIEEIKQYETIDRYRVFVLKESKNLFVAILCPSPWSYEWGEAWYPDTTWNRTRKVGVLTDSEGFFGRTTYARLGGCYYSSRLATAEYLRRIRRQATAIVWREIYPGFNVPIGVWFVREMLRKMYAGKYCEFDTLEDALRFVDKHSNLDVGRWIEKSTLVKRGRQRTLWEFM